MSKRTAKAKKEGGGGSLMWMQGLACGVAATLMPGTAVLVAVLLVPGLCALVLDRQPTRPLARCMLLCGLAVAVQPLRSLWDSTQGLEESLRLITNVSILGYAWMAACAGWLMAEVIPLVVRVVLDASSLAHAARLRSARERLVEQWGATAGGSDPAAQ